MSSTALDALDPRDLGQRLQRARKKAGLTQAAAADVIGAVRTTMVAIEKGARAVRPTELVALARAYGHPVSGFMREQPSTEPFSVQFRATPGASSLDDAIQPSVEQWHDLCLRFVELEQALGAPLPTDYPPEYGGGRLPIDLRAETIAATERRRLGLGDGPIPRLRDVLEQEVGLRVFYLPLPSAYSEMYAFDEALGGCLAINQSHPVERQRWSLAHGYLHFLAHRQRPVVHHVNQYQRLPASERLAEAFAKHFLMPTTSLSKRFEAYRRDGTFSVADLLTIADYYGVGAQTLVFRLEELGLLSVGTWDHLEGRGFKVREVQGQLGLSMSDRERVDVYPLYYQHLAIEALDSGAVTESRFADLLGLDRVRARAVAAVLRERSSGLGEGTLSLDLSALDTSDQAA